MITVTVLEHALLGPGVLDVKPLCEYISLPHVSEAIGVVDLGIGPLDTDWPRSSSFFHLRHQLGGLQWITYQPPAYNS